MGRQVAGALSAVLLLALPAKAQGQETQLRPEYPLCRAGTQLTFFISPSVTDLYGGGVPDSVRVYPDGHPDKTASMMVNGRFQTVTKARKSFDLGDCRPPREVAGRTVTVVEDCTEDVPLPNGGCRAVRVDGLDPAEWYTFGDALRTGGG